MILTVNKAERARGLQGFLLKVAMGVLCRWLRLGKGTLGEDDVVGVAV